MIVSRKLLMMIADALQIMVRLEDGKIVGESTARPVKRFYMAGYVIDGVLEIRDSIVGKDGVVILCKLGLELAGVLTTFRFDGDTGEIETGLFWTFVDRRKIWGGEYVYVKRLPDDLFEREGLDDDPLSAYTELMNGAVAQFKYTTNGGWSRV